MVGQHLPSGNIAGSLKRTYYDSLKCLRLLTEQKDNIDLAKLIQRWDRLLISPALLATWALGITLAITGDWFTQGWLQVKLILVLVLSAFHGMQAGHLRRTIEGREPPQRTLIIPILIGVTAIAIAIAIAILAALKPG